ncbi:MULTISPECIES: histidinol-phosphate transaminase [Dyella]|uniref:Histidinol-phosphate aminotransferase n=2 Tax=Dyella TaxID=231454 RepID=A0A4R0YWR6_9GAMM|nr:MULTISPECIES: histidinol-phosphate transaminase [Dyella]TBR39103.1 histidinol-phosphate transaminase [Dyella terrae]TCI13872.1 histidinol-phosphate transaminase [Dyella soli]
MSVLDLARPDIRALQPYSSARMEASGGEIFLNANESAWSPEGAEGNGCNRYPEPQPRALIERLAALYGVPAGQLLVGRGSDEIIDLLVRAFCRAGQDAVLIQPPTFGMYAVCARIQGAAVLEVPLEQDFSVDADKLLDAVTPAVKLVFVCAPNNPTGQVVPLATIQSLAQRLEGRALLVVDEAYLEFSANDSAIRLLETHEHLVVLRTLSKAWALAGARIGALVAKEPVIELLRRVIAPYPLPQPCVRVALEAMSPAGETAARDHIAFVRKERDRLANVMRQMPGVRGVLPSSTNFLTVRLDDAGAVYQRLLSVGIVVRDVRRYPGLSDALRITIGTAEENARVISLMQGVSA